MALSLCGDSISSRRGLLASLWTLVTILTAISFLTAFVFALSSKAAEDENDDYYYYNNQNGEGSQDQGEYADPEMAVTSRALAFSALWTTVLAALMSVFGTVILGWQSPTGQYYTCCSNSVHRTTPLGLGSFIGALLMLANLTLICSVLFGEFQVRDYRENEDRNGQGDDGLSGKREERSSMVFSVLCMCLTILYAGFAALTFAYANSVMDEHTMDEREEAMISTRNKVSHFNGYNGYIGERFDVGRPRNGPASFVSPSVPEATLA